MHQRAKQRPAGVQATQHTQNLLKMGLNARNLDAEDCALYVEKPLVPREIAVLKSQGIEIHETYVPPVPGHHPLGFYLATVAYTSLDQVESDARILKLETTEDLSEPENDLAAVQTNVDAVHNGWGVTARTGAGVKIAIADSGLDLTHPDIPTPAEAYDMTDGTGPSTWGTDVSNKASAHGTHVTGTVVGSGGLSGGQYMGMAPGATLYFYKIGNDTNAGANETDQIEAINRAVTVGCKIFSMSYGGYHPYMDGSSALCQAIDAAVADGMTCFISAGNEGTRSLHTSADVAPGTTSSVFNYTPSNVLSTGTPIYFRLNWQDGAPGDGNIAMACTNLNSSETLTLSSSLPSDRGTEYKLSSLTTWMGTTRKTYSFTLQNTATSGNTPKVHIYDYKASGTFNNADASYTITNPAMADSAIAVGAWTHRTTWTNSLGVTYSLSGYTVGTLAPFSSRGPRIDGALKPEIVAPGAATISTRESVGSLASNATYIIDNDGYNLDGSGPANYYVMSGTSMACPHAAGLAALVLEAHPSLTPAQLKQALTSTASQAGSPNNTVGYGLPNALSAVALDFEPPTVTLATTTTEPTHLASIPITVTLSEAASNFTADDVTVTNATLQDFSGSGTTYTFRLVPTAAGAVSAQVGAEKFTDAAGNANRASNLLTRTFIPVGALTVTLTPPEAIDAGTQWRRTGSSTWFNSGDTEGDIPVGSHTVEFKPITGWTAPSNQLVTIASGETTTTTAHYTLNTYTLTYSVGSHGSLEGVTPQTVPYGSDGTTVTAVPDIGYHFVKWSDDSTRNPRTDTKVAGDLDVMASFALNEYALTVSALNGSVSKSPDLAVYPHGTPVTLTAVPATGYHFTGWSGAMTTTTPLIVTMDSTRTLTANFEINQYTLTYTAGPNGKISGISPQTVNHGANGTPVTAVPDTGYGFVQWSDGSTANPRTDTHVTTHVAVTAQFAIPYTVSFQTDGTPGVTLSGNTVQTVFQGMSSTPVAAVGSADHYFVKWTRAGSDYSTANPLTIAPVNQAMSLTAVFASRSPLVWVDFQHSGSSDGTQAAPFPTLTQGLAAVSPGGTLRINSGQTGERNRITQPVRLEAVGGPVRLGATSK